MKRKISQEQLEGALRSHFGAIPEPAEPQSLAGSLRALPEAPRPIRRSPATLPALLAVAAVAVLAAALVGLPLVISRNGPAASAEPSGSPQPSETPTAVASDEPFESPVWSDEPSDGWPSPDASPSVADTGDPNWWRSVVITYTARVKGNTKDYVTVKTQGATRCGEMVVHYSDDRMDQPLGGFSGWRDPSRQWYIDVQETFVGVAYARMTCWRDGANKGPSHSWRLAITVDPADLWEVTAWVVLGADGRSGSIHYTTANWMWSCGGDVLPASGSADVTYVPADGFSGRFDFVVPNTVPAGTANWDVVCSDQWGVANYAHGTLEIAPPTPTPTPTPTPAIEPPSSSA